MNIAELLTIPSEIVPDAELIRFEGCGLSYSTVTERALRLSGVLREHGVRHGDRVAVLQTNTPDFVESLYGVTALGAVLIPLNYRARSDELRLMLATTTPRVLLAGTRYAEVARDAVAGLAQPPRVLVLDEHGQLELVGDQGVNGAGIEAPEAVADDDLAIILLTSGTTAAPKAVMLDHAAIANLVIGTTELADGGNRGAVLIAAPLYHIAGLSSVLTATFGGRRIVLMRQFEPSDWLYLAVSEHVTHAFLVPTMLKQVLDHPDFPAADLTSLEILSYGAAPMPSGVIRRAIECFPPGVQFINAFGQTETTSTVTMLGPEDHRLSGSPPEIELKVQRLGSIGRALPDVEVSIVDAAGRELPAGQVGEIAIRTDRVMRGYYGDQSSTDSVLRAGWLRTRDLGWIDSGGYVFLAGRSSDVIIRGGENIAPMEVEQVLTSHPAVEEAAVFGIADDEWGETVAAAIVLVPGCTVTAEALTEYTRRRLATFKKPERILFVEQLPRNSIGKVLRKDLKSQLSPP